MSEDAMIRVISSVGNGAAVAVALLAKSLQSSGVLEKGAYENALSGTINQPGAISDRPDYLFLQRVLNYMQDEEPPTPARMRFRVIEGGLSNEGA